MRRLTVLLLALACLGAVASPAASVAATATPSCPALAAARPGTVAWIDEHSAQSQLVRGLGQLICSAADGATVDVKSWYIKDDGPTVQRLVDDLKLMHRYHHVTVNVHVGQNAYVRSDALADFRAFLATFSFANVSVCKFSCLSTEANGSSHAKWVSVSRLRDSGLSAVLSMSANLAGQQLDLTDQTGLLVVGDDDLYGAFVERFRRYQTCSADARSTACDARARAAEPAVHWFGDSASTQGYFTPIIGDPIASELAATTCHPASAHRSIVLASLQFDRPRIEKQLTRLRAEGCSVRVLLEHPPQLRNYSFVPRCVTNHDKTMIIDTDARRVVYSGSEDFVNFALHVSDNQTIRTTDASAVAAYESHYDRLWQRGTPCVYADAGTLPAGQLAGSLRLTFRTEHKADIASYDVRYRSGRFDSALGPWRQPAAWSGVTGSGLTAGGLAQGWTYCYSVRAHDRSGHTSAWSPSTCSARALDDRSLNRSTGWHRNTARSWWNETATITRTRGAAVRLATSDVRRLGVVATTCAQCGSVALYVGSRRVGVISLRAGTTHHRQLLMLPALSAHGSVTVRVTTSAMMVNLDGLVVRSV